MFHRNRAATWLLLTLSLISAEQQSFVAYTSPISYATLLDGESAIADRTPAQCAVFCATKPGCKLFSVENGSCELLAGRIRVMDAVYSWQTPFDLYVPPAVLKEGKSPSSILSLPLSHCTKAILEAFIHRPYDADIFDLVMWDPNVVSPPNTGSTVAFEICQTSTTETCCNTEPYSWISGLADQGLTNEATEMGELLGPCSD